MFKRESEQPVRISFEEKREKRKKRSIRERLSSIPVRRRIEAVALSVVTIMASLSIDWSSLLANAAEGQATIDSGKSIYSLFSSSGSEDTVTSLSTATIYVEKPTGTKTVSYTWEVYQNFTNERQPEKGVKVASSSKTETINSSSADTEGFVPCEADLSEKGVVLLGSEKAAVVFKLTSNDSTITYKTFNDLDIHYVKEYDGSWSISKSGNCTKYGEGVGTLTPVTLSGLPDGNKLALTENETHDFSGLSWAPYYKRNPQITEITGATTLISKNGDLGITVEGSIDKGGTAKVKIGGNGVNEEEVTVNVVKLKMNGTEEDSVYTYDYQGKSFSSADLFTATCGENNDITSDLTTTFTGPLTNGEPWNVGSYDMTVTGDSDYAGLSYEKTFRIEPKSLEASMFTGTPTVKEGKLQHPIIGGEFAGKALEDGLDFNAEITGTTPGVDVDSGKTVVTYTITVTGMGNFKDSIELTAKGTSGVQLGSVVDHIAFKEENGTYNGSAQEPPVVLYDKDNNPIDNSSNNISYTIVYNGTTRAGKEVKDAASITDAGQYTATIVGGGIYTGSVMTTQDTYVLKPITIDDSNVTAILTTSNFEYSDSLKIEPQIISVTYTGSTPNMTLVNTTEETKYELKSGVNYPTTEGTHFVYISGRGNFEGEAAAASYTVFPSITSAKVAFDGDRQGSMKADSTYWWDYVWTCSNPITYTGSEIEPDEVTVTIGDTAITWNSSKKEMDKSDGSNNIDVTSSEDKANFILTLPDKYAKKRIKVEFDIAPKPLDEEHALNLQNAPVKKDYAFGEEITLNYTTDSTTEYYVQDDKGNKLKKDIDFEIKYKNNVNAGTATITATGIGNYSGSSWKTFTINKTKISNGGKLEAKVAPQEFNKTGATVIDKSEVEFYLNGKKLDEKAFTPEDFDLSGYKNNKNAWIAGEENIGDQPQVTLTGKRNLEGTYVLKFEIVKETLEGLIWKLNTDSSIYGVLGKPDTTVNLSEAPYNYVIDYEPNLPSRFVNLYVTVDSPLSGGNFTRVYETVHAGTNYIKVKGCGDYKGNEYTFTYEANRLDIKNCEVEQTTDGSSAALPEFKLTYKSKVLTAGTDYEATPEIKKNGVVYTETTYEPGEYTATFTGKGSYEGTKEADFHIGKPFDSDHVFVTMYGPAGTTTVNGENRLTYFGNNDPYFILTSDEANGSESKIITGPSYTDGTCDKATDGLYDISWEPSDPDERRMVGKKVTVTFKAKDKGDTWYNPENSNGIEYKYTVVPGSPIGGTGYGDIGSMLSVYTERTDGTPGSKSDEKIKFPEMAGWYNQIDLTRSSAPSAPLVYNYTTEPADPNLWISYNPVASARVSQSQGAGIPKLDNEISYAKPFVCPFSNIFDFKQGSTISATDTDRRIIVTPTSGSWLRTTKNNKEAEIRVAYDFDNASLSDAEITLEPSNGEYAYTGSSVEPKYMVTMGGSTLSEGTDYVLVGYFKIDKDKVLPKPSEVTDSTLSNIGTKLNENEKPTNAGTYAFVIGPAEGGHYSGYNIAKFTIDTAKLTATVIDPESFSVIYKGENTELPTPTKDNLSVTGVDGTPLNYTGEGSKEDGYYIKPDKDMVKKPRTNATAWVCGTGNYENANDDVSYSIIANIKKDETPNFEKTNLGLTDTYSDSNNCFPLTLDSNGGLTYSTTDGTKKSFNLTDLTLSDGTKNGELKYGEHLTAIVTGINSDNNIATVGKKQITIEAATDAPVKEKRYYYVEVFGDISTAELTFYAGGVKVDGTEIAYTGDTIDVKPSLMFGGYPLINGEYENKSIVPQDGYLDVAKHTMTLEGKTAKYYTGTLSKDFSIVYDLGKNIEIIYNGDNEKLSGHKFDYTGKPVVSRDNIFVKVEGKATKLEESKGDYDISFGSVTSPGTGSVRIEGKSPRSKGSQTVNFYIVGSDFKDGTCVVTLDSTRQVYDGTEKKPAVLGVEYTGKDGVKRNLTEGQDFDVSYSNNINATTEGKKAIVTIKGKNGYSGNALKEFDIEPKALTTAIVKFPNVPFGGRKSDTEYYPATPTITVKDGETILQEKKDYEIKYGSGSEGDSFTDDASAYFTKAPGGKYTINITGKGNYYTEPNKPITATAEQLPGDLKNARIDPSLLKSPYDGTNQKDTILSKLVVKNGECTLVRGTDYEVTVPDSIINAGTYPITISATEGDYKGTSNTFTYEVTQRSIEELEVTLYDPNTGSIVSESSNFKWTGSKIEPAVKLEDKGLKPDAGVAKAWTNKDGQAMVGFKVTYGTNTNAGSKEDKAGVVTLTASAGGNYTGTLTRYFAIGQDIANASITYDKYTADYDGTPKIPKITVKCNGKILEAGTAYEDTIEFEWAGGKTNAPEKVGSYTPVIVGKPDGGYYGELKGTPPFMITATNKSGDIRITFNGPQGEVEAADYVCHYNGSKQEPSINVYDKSSGLKLTRDIDYTVTYGNNTNVGSAYVYVWLEGNYTGSAKEIFFIEPYDISNLTPVITEGENGVIKNVPESKFPYVPIFKLVGTDDYGKPFEISYGTSTYKPYLSVPDSSKVKKPGKGTLTVTGKGNLIGTTNACEYEVYGRLSESNVSVKAPVYTGTKKDPEVTVTFAGEKLVLDTDYSLRIIPYDQTATGGGNVVVTGLGYFSGNIYTKYGEAGEVSALELRGYSQQYVYSGNFAGPSESALYAADSEGNVIIPADKLNCTFTSSVDKTACVSAGATVTITTKATLDDGSVVDGPSGTYKIVARDISSCDVKQLSSDNYTGKPLTPPISVSYDRKTYSGTVVTGHDVIALVSGRDYSLSYSNNTNPGTAVVTVTGKGNYTGSKRFMFTIKVADMATVTARQSSEGTIVSWTARPHVTGYRVLYNTNGMTKEETSRTTMTLRDAVPTVVGVQAYVKDSAGNITYGTPKYVAVTR